MDTEKQEHINALRRALEKIDAGLSFLNFHVEQSIDLGFFIEPELLSTINEIKSNRETIASFIE